MFFSNLPGSHIAVGVVDALPKVNRATVLAESLLGQSTYRWATAEILAVNFGQNWGKSETPLIVGNKLDPLILKDEILSTQQLRTLSYNAGDKEIEILQELDGPLQGFGKRFWRLITQLNPAIAALLSNKNVDVTNITYHDRYLFSPLATALLVDLITGLRDTVGIECWDNPEIKITTTNISSSGNNRRRFVWDNWPDMSSRNGAITQALDYNGMSAKIYPVDKYKSQHGRAFEVTLSSKQVLTVRLDQGVSYWRAIGSSHGEFFNFHETDLSIQGMQLAELIIDIESGAFSTHLFTKIRND